MKISGTWRSIPLLLAVLVVCGACAGRQDRLGLRTELADPLSRPVILDVRSGSEFRRGHIPGAVNISVFSLPFRTGDIPVRSKAEPIVVYCGHGPRAGLAGFILRIAGFSDVRHLEGDMSGWRNDGLPVETSANGS